MNIHQGRFAGLAFAAALAATGATLLATGAPAHAAGHAAPRAAVSRSIAVAHGDLDLASADGLGALETRIRNAAERACEVGAAQSPSAGLAARQCVKAAIAGAAPQIGLAVARHRELRSATLTLRSR